LTPHFPAHRFKHGQAGGLVRREADVIARTLLAAAAIACLAAPALADDAQAPKLPTFAAYGPDGYGPSAASPSPWAGLYAGSEVIASMGRHSKGHVGGDVFIGYRRALPDNFIIAFEARAGFSPSLFRDTRFSGYNFAETSVKIGYQMGRLTPFVTASAGFARPNIRGASYSGANDSINALFASGPDLRAFGTVGAGFDYAVTNNLSVGLAVSAGAANGRGLLLAP
jgi:outer membrane immunogenic protein